MIDPYTPTTEEVRTGYSDDGMFTEKREGMFDRWLAQHDAELRQQVAREIRAEARAHLDEEIPLGNSMRTCALGDAYVNAARIAEGPTMDRVESR